MAFPPLFPLPSAARLGMLRRCVRIPVGPNAGDVQGNIEILWRKCWIWGAEIILVAPVSGGTIGIMISKDPYANTYGFDTEDCVFAVNFCDQIANQTGRYMEDLVKRVFFPVPMLFDNSSRKCLLIASSGLDYSGVSLEGAVWIQSLEEWP